MKCAPRTTKPLLAAVLSAVFNTFAPCDDVRTPSLDLPGEESAAPPAAAPPENKIEGGYYAVDICSEVDPGGQQLRGLRFGAGAVGDPGMDNDGHAETSIAVLIGDGQHTYRAEMGAALTLFGIKELLFAPRFGLGLEYRTSPPDPGWAGLFALGIEMSSWIKKKAELAFYVDRNFGFPSGTRNQFGVAVRWHAKRLPWWPKVKKGQTGQAPANPNTASSQ